MSRQQRGTAAEVSGTVLVPCSLGVSFYPQLQLVLCIPVSVLDPAAPSVVLTYLSVCPHHNQSLGTIQPKTKYSSSGLISIWLPVPAHTPCHYGTGVARRGKRRVTRPKVCSGRLQSKHDLEYPNKLSLHSHHYPSELTLYRVDLGHSISHQCWNLVVRILHYRRDVLP